MDLHSVADSDLAFTPEPRITIRLTRFEKPIDDGAMTKTIKLGADGQPVSDASKCKMWRGKAETITVEGATELAEAIGACTSRQAFAMGVVRPELAGAKTDFDVVKKDVLADAAKGTIARSQEHFEFAPGQPAAMPLDFDQKGMSFGARRAFMSSVVSGRRSSTSRRGSLKRRGWGGRPPAQGLWIHGRGKNSPAAAACTGTSWSKTAPTSRGRSRPCTNAHA